MIDKLLNSIDNLVYKISPYVLFSVLNTAWRSLDKEIQSILDLGCGEGGPMKFINRHKGFFTVGMDIFEPYLKKCQRQETHNQYVLCDARTLPFRPKSFDVIWCCEVLEHMNKQDSRRLIKKMERIAKRQVIITTPVGPSSGPSGDGNPYQEHKEAWYPIELKRLGYRARGAVSLSRLRMVPRLLRILKPLLYLYWSLAGPFVYFCPKLAWHMICIKNLGPMPRKERGKGGKMKVALMGPFSKRDVLKGRNFWFFKYMKNPSLKLDILNYYFELPIQRKIHMFTTLFLSTFRILTFLPRAKRYDIVISMGLVNGLVLSFLRNLFRIRKPSHVIFDIQIGRYFNSSWGLWLIRFLLSPLDHAIALTKAECLRCQECLRPSYKVSYIPCCVDTDHYQPSTVKHDYVFSGGYAYRDFATLVSAMKQINTELVLVTGKDCLKGGDIPENVKVFFDVPGSKFKDLLSRAKFVILPLKDLFFPLGLTSLTQAMAMGKTVIVTKNETTIDYVTDWESGIFLQPQNVGELREKITFLLGHPEEVERIGRNAREMAVSRFSEQVVAKKMERVLEEVYANGGGKKPCKI